VGLPHGCDLELDLLGSDLDPEGLFGGLLGLGLQGLFPSNIQAFFSFLGTYIEAFL
jgi:hypothetical protein